MVLRGRPQGCFGGGANGGTWMDGRLKGFGRVCMSIEKLRDKMVKGNRRYSFS